MKSLLPVGLVVEGNATTSSVLRLPGFGDHLGPVKSNTLRVARRFTNSFRAGKAVDSYEELRNTRLVILRVPDAALNRIIDQLCDSELNLGDMCFAACETWLASDSLASLQQRGATVATVSLVPGSGPRWFITEGDKAALRQIRRLLESAGARVITLRNGTKPLYFAAEHLATALPLPLLFTAQTALRDAGISGKILTAIVDRLAQRLMKNLRAGNRMTPAGPFQQGDPAYSEAQLEAIGNKVREIAATLSSKLEQLSPVSRHPRQHNSNVDS